MVKRFFSILIIICTLFSLSACTSFADLKESYAYFYDKDGQKRISYKGQSYIPMQFNQLRSNFDSRFEYDKIQKVNAVKDKEVPILLSEKMGETFIVSTGGELLWRYEGYYSVIKSVYVREDYIEEFENAINLKCEYYCKLDNKWELISDELKRAVKDILSTVTPEYYHKKNDWVHSVAGIARCDKNVAMVLEKGGIGMLKHAGVYGICPHGEYDEKTGITAFYPIPERYVELFKTELSPIL